MTQSISIIIFQLSSLQHFQATAQNRDNRQILFHPRAYSWLVQDMRLNIIITNMDYPN